MTMQTTNFAPGGPLSLTSKHIIAAALLATGSTQREIARTLGFSEMHVSHLCQSLLFQQQVEMYRAKLVNDIMNGAVGKLRSETLNNVSELVRIRDDRTLSPNVRLRAINSMLDRVPETATTQKIQSETKPQVFSDDQVEKLLAYLEDDNLASEAFRQGASADLMGMLSVEDDDEKQLTSVNEVEE